MKHLLGKFAYLPNGIIREIIAYTGATYKKRNGKYMGQIPKTDPRFALLLKIPKKQIIVNDHLVSNPNCKYFTSWVSLTRIHERRLTIRLAVFGVTYTNDPIFGNRETIEYECRICDWRGDVRFETYKYFRKDEIQDNLITNYDNTNDSVLRTTSSVSFPPPSATENIPIAKYGMKIGIRGGEVVDFLTNSVERISEEFDKIKNEIDAKIVEIKSSGMKQRCLNMTVFVVASMFMVRGLTFLIASNY